MDAFHSSFLPQAIHTPFIFLKHHTPKKGSESTDIFLLTIFSTGILLNKPQKKGHGKWETLPTRQGATGRPGAPLLFFLRGVASKGRSFRAPRAPTGSDQKLKDRDLPARPHGERGAGWCFILTLKILVVPKGEGDANLPF